MTETQIYQAMLERFQEETGYQMHSTGDLAVRLRAAAAQIMGLYHYGDHLYRQAFPQTAQEESLDLHGELRGISRMEARQATGVLKFGISVPMMVDLAVASGTVCLSGEGMAFETVEDVMLRAGETSVEAAARAVEPGTLGNAVAGSITRMQTAPDGIETVTNPHGFTGGRDREADGQYRERILESCRGLSNGANIAFYRELALGVDGIDQVQVAPCINGPGSVGLMVAAEHGTVSDTALEELEALLKSRRELGIEVVVSLPENVAVTVKADILPAEGYTLGQAMSLVEEAIAACFTGERMGKTLYLAALSHSAMATGAIDNIVFRQPTADVTVTTAQQTVPESITLEGM